MNKFKDFLRIRKLKKEIKRHDKSYIDKKNILGYDTKTGIPIYSFDNKKKLKKCWQIYFNVV